MQVQISAWLSPFFFSFIVFEDFDLSAFYCLFSPPILLALRDFCQNVFLVKQSTGQRTASTNSPPYGHLIQVSGYPVSTAVS